MAIITNTQQHVDAAPADSYPFVDGSTFTSINNVFVPPTVFTDARLYPINASNRQYISQIDINFTGAKFYISDANDVVATGEASSSANEVLLYDEYNRQVGLLLVDVNRLRSISAANTVLEFSTDAMTFVPSVVSPQPQIAINSVRDKDNNIAYGDVWLVGEDGVVLTYTEATNTISVHVIGDKYFARRACADEQAATWPNTPLKSITINGNPVDIDDNGNFFFMPGKNVVDANILRIESLDNELRFKIVGGAGYGEL